MDNNPGTSRFKETTLGKLEAMIALGQLDEAQKIALDTAGDKTFRGESAGKALILMGRIYRKQAAKTAGTDAKLELYKQAYGTYLKVYGAYKSTPEVCAEAGWQAYETAIEMGNQTLADQMIKALASEPKLANTARAKKAVELAK